MHQRQEYRKRRFLLYFVMGIPVMGILEFFLKQSC